MPKAVQESDPLNDYARGFLVRLDDEDAARKGGAGGLDDNGSQCAAGSNRFAWIDPPRRVQCLGTLSKRTDKRQDNEATRWHKCYG